eukprot:scaffold421256_cov54-Attheya_sp.AAC.3
MTTLYMYSRPNGLRFEFDGYEEATFDPSSISNGCWDQKLAHVAAWCGGGDARYGPQPRRTCTGTYLFIFVEHIDDSGNQVSELVGTQVLCATTQLGKKY